MAPKRILVCDDDSLFRKTLSILLKPFGEVTTVQDTDEALRILSSRAFDLILLDVQMRTPDEGIRALSSIRALDRDATLVMLSGVKDFRTVREALVSGADDWLGKDFEPEEFKITIERALEKRRLEKVARKRGSETSRAAGRIRLVGESPALALVRKWIEKFRASDANVLITGETGTGKEIVARSLRGAGADGSPEPFVAVDSATLHAQTAESILFGHEKGAFTGADSLRRGLFEEADGGIIFFDEIANMPLAIQAKLLRVLQEKEVVRLGSARPVPLEFRVVAATNRSLDALAAKGEFLPDLLQRLNVLPLSIPPLRERKEDIPALVEHFLESKSGGTVRMTEDALALLAAYDWPGNVRELSALVDYSLAMIDDSVIDAPDLHPKVRETRPSAAASDDSFYERMGAYEAAILREAYAKHEGNVSRLAAALGMDRSHLHAKLKLHGIHSARSKS